MGEVVAVTGATGMIGRLVCKQLLEAGHIVRSISRSASRHPIEGVETYVWDVDKMEIDPKALQGATTVIHLAGESIASGRWTEANRQRIWDSRVQTAALLSKALQAPDVAVHTIIGASAIGYYAPHKLQIDETGRAGDDFPAQVCKAWEQAEEAMAQGRRLVILRIGVVLSRDGGAFPKLAAPIRAFLGAWLGNGHQVMSWIHGRDVAGLLCHAVDNTEMHGVYNAVANEPCSQRFFLKQVARYLHRPLWPIGVPSFVMRLVLGDMAQLVLSGSIVVSARLAGTGYKLKYPYLYDALRELCKTRR
jgi:uncharacterized protein